MTQFCVSLRELKSEGKQQSCRLCTWANPFSYISHKAVAPQHPEELRPFFFFFYPTSLFTPSPSAPETQSEMS